jgi:hypothetical protein
MLREDLEDTLKEYMELDLVVELIQNALDAIDRRRYEAIAVAADRNPDDVETIRRWNAAVTALIEKDVTAYEAADGQADRAVLYRTFADDPARRTAWWGALSEQFGASAADLASAATSFRGRLRVAVRLGPPHWIEVEDNGVGMMDVLECFRHKASASGHLRSNRDGTACAEAMGGGSRLSWGSLTVSSGVVP